MKKILCCGLLISLVSLLHAQKKTISFGIDRDFGTYYKKANARGEVDSLRRDSAFMKKEVCYMDYPKNTSFFQKTLSLAEGFALTARMVTNFEKFPFVDSIWYAHTIPTNLGTIIINKTPTGEWAGTFIEINPSDAFIISDGNKISRRQKQLPEPQRMFTIDP